MEIEHLIKKMGIPLWLIVIAVSVTGIFLIYRSLLETELVELQIKQAQKDLKNNTGNA